MTKEKYISLAVSNIKNKKDKKIVADEIENHIDERISYYTDCGYDLKSAEKMAVDSMGSAEIVSAQFGEIYRNVTDKFLNVLLIINCIVAIHFQALIFYLLRIDINGDTLRFSFADYAMLEFIGLLFSLGLALFACKFKNHKSLAVTSVIFFGLNVSPGLYYLLNSAYSAIISRDLTEAYNLLLTVRSPAVIGLYAVITGNADCLSVMTYHRTVYFESLPVTMITIIIYCALAVLIIKSYIIIFRADSAKASKKDLSSKKRVIKLLTLFSFCFCLVLSSCLSVCLFSQFKTDESNYCDGCYIVESDSKEAFEDIDLEDAAKFEIEHNIPREEIYNRTFIEAQSYDSINVNTQIMRQKLKLKGADYEYTLITADYKPVKRYIAIITEKYVPNSMKNRAITDYSNSEWFDTESGNSFSANYTSNEYPELKFQINVLR